MEVQEAKTLPKHNTQAITEFKVEVSTTKNPFAENTPGLNLASLNPFGNDENKSGLNLASLNPFGNDENTSSLNPFGND